MEDFLNFLHSVADSVSGVCAAPAGLSQFSACRSRILPGQTKDGKHRPSCNRQLPADNTAKLSKKETGSHEPVPIIFRCRKNLLGGDNDNLDVSEDALVALHLALELTELLDVGNGDVLALDLDACGCENLGNLG